MNDLKIEKHVKQICGWPTDVASIDYHRVKTMKQSKKCFPHTILMFVPGNPGCIGWYIPMLYDILEKLGIGYAVRAVSYAGHGIGKDIIGTGKTIDGQRDGAMLVEVTNSSMDCKKRESRVAWTIGGQLEHKIQWIDQVNSEMIALRQTLFHGTESEARNYQVLPRFVFMSHSFGAYLVERFCLKRKDILFRTKKIVHLMPFHRFDPYPRWKKVYLSKVAHSPEIAIAFLRAVSKIVSMTPVAMIDSYLKIITGLRDQDGRDLARTLYSQPAYARNFLELGLEEIRSVPKVHDFAGLNAIGQHCPISILYCGGPDQWAPYNHMNELKEAQKNGLIPTNISFEYIDDLVHGFVVNADMIPPVVDFSVRSIMMPNHSKGTVLSHL